MIAVNSLIAESVIKKKKELDQKNVSSLTAVYSMNITASSEHLDLGNLFNKTGMIKGAKIKKKKKKKTLSPVEKLVNFISDAANSLFLDESENQTLDKSKPVEYVMTYGKLGIGKNNQVFFPFLSSFEIQVLEISKLHSINTIWNTKELNDRGAIKYGENDEKTSGDKNLKKIMNCIITIEFSIPATLQSNEGYLYAMYNLALSTTLKSKSLVINYLNDSEKIIISDLISYDFDSGSFNPISSSGFDDLTFTRSFVGRINMSDSKKDFLVTKYVDKKKKSLTDADTLDTYNRVRAGKKNNLTKEQRMQAVKAAEKLAIEKEKARERLQASNPLGTKPKEGEEPNDYKKGLDEYNYIVSFLAEGIDFKTTYLAEDSAMENSGLIQVLSIFNEVKEITTYDYTTFDMKLVLPSGKDVRKEIVRRTSGKKDKTDKLVNVPLGKVGEEQVSSTNEMFGSAMTGQGGIKAFNLTLRLPRAIMTAEVFQDILLINSRFGVYDGIWRIFKITLSYEENGQLTQEFLMHPKSLIGVSNKKKNTVKVIELTTEEKREQRRKEIMKDLNSMDSEERKQLFEEEAIGRKATGIDSGLLDPEVSALLSQ